MPPDDKTPAERVPAHIIRQYFNESQIYKKMASGEYTTYIKRSSHPNPPPPGEPYCTHSQIVYYYTKDGRPVAIVHQYLRPNGSIGASGMPDPKRLFLADRILYVSSKQEK